MSEIPHFNFGICLSRSFVFSHPLCFFNILKECSGLLDVVKGFHLPSVKPRWVDITDAWPEVGIYKIKVRFKGAELSILHSRDYRVRIHYRRDSSGNNEAEHTVWYTQYRRWCDWEMDWEMTKMKYYQFLNKISMHSNLWKTMHGLWPLKCGTELMELLYLVNLWMFF